MSLVRAQVQFLVGKLRSCAIGVGWQKKKKKVKVHSDYPADFRVVEGYSESRRTNL